MTADVQNVFTQAIDRFNLLAKVAGLNQETIAALNNPEAVLSVMLPLRRDDGHTQYFQAYRCRYNTTLGPAKGGIRYHPAVTLPEVQALALWMTIKCALLALPYGGGKGGVVVDPKQLSPLELERLSRAYIRAMGDFIGPEIDIPAPDVYTNARIMGWMANEYAIIKGRTVPDVITGKPVILGGSLGRDEATGRGAFIIIQAYAQQMQWQPREKTVAIQGLGNAGYHVARLLQQAGYQIVAISDSHGAIYRAEGLDVESIYQQKQKTKQLGGVYCQDGVCTQVEYQPMTNEELLALDVDILIPAALESVIHQSNVEFVRAKTIVEVANGPVVGDVDAILAQKGIVVLPDVLVNAGGVVVSYFEWVQNRQRYAWTLAEVREKLEKQMVDAYSRVAQMQAQQGGTWRSAAYTCALQRIAEGIDAQGGYAYFAEAESK